METIMLIIGIFLMCIAAVFLIVSIAALINADIFTVVNYFPLTLIFGAIGLCLYYSGKSKLKRSGNSGIAYRRSGGVVMIAAAGIITVVIIIVASFSASRGSNSKNTSSLQSAIPVTTDSVSLKDIAKEADARVNENTWEIYGFETSNLSENGEGFIIGGMSVQDVSLHNTFDAGGNILNNSIVFEVGTTKEYLIDFLTHKAFIVAYDREGKEYSDFTSASWYDKVNDKLYMIFDSATDKSKCKYVVIGGFSADKNKGYNKAIFEIK